jgi:hypothetical protein
MDKEGITGIDGDFFGSNSQMLLGNPQILGNSLQFTVEILGAHQAILRMTGEHQFHGHSAYLLNLRCFGLHHHPLFCLQST